MVIGEEEREDKLKVSELWRGTHMLLLLSYFGALKIG